MGSALKFLLSAIAFILAWTLLTLLLTAQLTFGGMAWTSSLVIATQQSLPWMFVSPLILLASLWFPILHERWWFNALLHLTLCLIALTSVDKLRTVLTKGFSAPTEKSIATAKKYRKIESISSEKQPSSSSPAKVPLSFSNNLIESVGHTAPLGIPLYISILLLSSLSNYRREIHQRDQAALRLETQLTQTQLDLLRSQLQPHFLFNTLNAISCLIYTDPEKADSMVLQLSDLLRSTLDQRDATFIPLKQELQTIQTYLDIQSTRFGDRIIIETDIAPGTMSVPVPPMILLPLAENSVKYAVEKSTKRTTIRIESSTKPGQLILKVTDDGPGIDAEETGGTGVGLNNTTNRLVTLYPEGTTEVTLTETPDGLTVATIKLPLTS